MASNRKRSRGRIKAYDMGQDEGPIVPLTVGDRVGIELLFNSVEFGVPSSCQQTPRELKTRCGREGHTRPRGTSETLDAVASRIPDSRDQMW